MQTYIYIRVSLEKQDFERQLSIFEASGFNLDVVYDDKLEVKEVHCDTAIVKFEKYTGTKLNPRKELNWILDNIQEGDLLLIESLSRLARSIRDLFTVVDTLSDKGAGFKSLKEDLDFTTATGKLLFTLLGGFIQFERDITSERTRDTLRAKKENGVVLGRPKKYNHEEIYQYKSSGKTYDETMKKFGVGRGTVMNIVKKYEDSRV